MTATVVRGETCGMVTFYLVVNDHQIASFEEESPALAAAEKYNSGEVVDVWLAGQMQPYVVVGETTITVVPEGTGSGPAVSWDVYDAPSVRTEKVRICWSPRNEILIDGEGSFVGWYRA